METDSPIKRTSMENFPPTIPKPIIKSVRKAKSVIERFNVGRAEPSRTLPKLELDIENKAIAQHPHAEKKQREHLIRSFRSLFFYFSLQLFCTLL